MDDDLIIDENNFTQYFHEAKRNRPKAGEVLARYTAMADFVKSETKNFVVNVLQKSKIGGDMAVQVLRNRCNATEDDAISLALKISQDLKSGMTAEEVEAKPYRFQVEYFYWTKPDYVPLQDPHWELITIGKTLMDKTVKEIELEEDLVKNDDIS